ncbi:Xaa-Pro aminopeptidase [Rubellimicrobium thermophilum DSM 16684]|uniref:Xaa-Pro aminopeptidase n=1 Tax=Rubellimicrobium thermophilum DSM 16684 TaxID=1123069 RepID=S9QYD0_9RHOB|nr:aminopeptidase P family protein [Rubellimicrobium thermophilum]EPX84623.1 Xaa-Pro aminopeptidase [Rubellimicrobium thermophilum DSM 16684]
MSVRLSTLSTPRPVTYRFHQGERVLPFAPEEYEARLKGLRRIMEEAGVEVAVLTSMHNVAYYSGFLYCAFGRPYALVVTPGQSVTIAAGIDGGQPWRRSHGDTLTYTDWARDNFWRAVVEVAGRGRHVGHEGDHLTLDQSARLDAFLEPRSRTDLAPATMRQRMRKSPAEIALIRQGAEVADLGGHAIRDAIRPGLREIDVAMVGRDAMEREIARRFPDAEYRDTWVWFQSGINTDGAHNPVTGRVLRVGDILSLNCFPMISGYYTALERTLFLREVDEASLRIWEANIAAHEYGMSLLRPGVSCAEVTRRINAFLEERDLLRYRSFGYGHSFGILSHYYGREGALELREDIDTVLEPGHVVSMEPMLTIPEGMPGAGGYREHDILVIGEDGAEDITRYPYGPGFNLVG